MQQWFRPALHNIDAFTAEQLIGDFRLNNEAAFRLPS